MKYPKISVLIPVYNSSSTVAICLDSLQKQDLKVSEIIIVDNNSKDNSIDVINKYKKKNKKIPIIVIKKPKTTSVASSYNIGLNKAKGEYILTMHSDSSLPTKKEISKLVRPLIEDKELLCSYSYVLHPQSIWDTYNFWEKCQSCRVVGKKIPAMNGKFDCYRKDALLKLNGFDDKNFDEHGDGLDADIHFRLKSMGKVAAAPAEVIHLHYLRNDYSLGMWIEKRKNMSITAGRLLKMYLLKTDLKGLISFSIRPILSLFPFIPQIRLLGLLLIILFSFFYTLKMFLTPSTLRDIRIISLPFINIFLIYFESFWIIYTFLTHNVQKKSSL